MGLSPNGILARNSLVRLQTLICFAAYRTLYTLSQIKVFVMN